MIAVEGEMTRKWNMVSTIYKIGFYGGQYGSIDMHSKYTYSVKAWWNLDSQFAF